MSWEAQGIALLTASVVRPFALAAAAWAILRLFRVQHPASRHAVWTAVLAGMLLLPLVSVIAPHWMAPVLPATRATAPEVVTFTDAEHFDVRQSTYTGKETAKKFAWPSREALIIWCYFAGLLAMMAYRMAGWAMLWRVMSRSRRLRGCLRESDDVRTPVAAGWLRPVVILPTGWRGWSANTRRAILAHEFGHLRRRDTLVSALSRWVRCVLWFQPLTWWVSREISELAELSCDAAALERVGDPVGYSRMLLGFAGAGSRVALPGLAMAATSGMDRRIDQLFELSGGNMRKLRRPGLLLVLMGVPVICLAAAVGLGETVPGEHTVRSRSPLAPAPSDHVAHTLPEAAIAPVAEPVHIAEVRAVQSTPVQPTTPQSQTAAPPEFDAASIKLNNNSGGGGRGGRGGGRIGFTPGRVASITFGGGVTARRMILEAYHLRGDYQLSGGPAWLDSDIFDLEAKTDTSADESQLRLMLQTLLSKRFQLVLHRESRDMPVYVMTVGNNGPKLPEGNAAGGPVTTPPSPGREHADAHFFDQGTMRHFADTLSNDFVDRIVLDQTDLKGGYIFRVDWFKTEDFVTVMQDELGLRFESRKAPVDVFVIDHIERPSEN